MDQKKSIVKKLKVFRKNLDKKFHVKRMILFGSLAAGKFHKDSDIDLIVVSPEFRGLNFFKRGARMYDYWNIRYPVDFLCYTPEEFRKLSKQITIVRDALKEGIETS